MNTDICFGYFHEDSNDCAECVRRKECKKESKKHEAYIKSIEEAARKVREAFKHGRLDE
jgi:hypothetical protein